MRFDIIKVTFQHPTSLDRSVSTVIWTACLTCACLTCACLICACLTLPASFLVRNDCIPHLNSIGLNCCMEWEHNSAFMSHLMLLYYTAAAICNTGFIVASPSFWGRQINLVKFHRLLGSFVFLTFSVSAATTNFCFPLMYCKCSSILSSN